MRRSIAGAVALSVLAALAAPAGFAGTKAVPAPTFTATTTVAGQPLPVATATGSWDVAKPGRSAALHMSVASAPGTQTTATGLWTSSWIRLGPRSGLHTECQTEHDGVTRDGLPASASLAVRFRTDSPKWSPWFTSTGEYGFTPLIVTEVGCGFDLRFVAARHSTSKAQLQLRIRATSADLSREDETWNIRVTG